MPGATKCDASPSAKRRDLERAVDAANQAKECARLSAQAAKQAQVAASTGRVVEKQIVRKGITKKCPLGGDRHPTVGYEGTDASSHCPVAVTLDLDRVA